MPRLSIVLAFSCVLIPRSIPALAQSTPACSLEGPNHCQAFEGVSGFTMSDLAWGWFVAEDFIPQTSTLSSVCVWGIYIDLSNYEPDCAFDVMEDRFSVDLYYDNGGLPGSAFNGSEGLAVRTPVTTFHGPQGTFTLYRFEISLQPTIRNLPTDGRRLWIRIAPNTQSNITECAWHWSQLPPASSNGNEHSAWAGESGFVPGSEYPHDHAFCLDLNMLPAAGGESVTRACCSCDGTCSILTQPDCEQQNGTWMINAAACDAAACPSAPPPNDACASAIEVTSWWDPIPINTRCAMTDGPNPVMTENGPMTIDGDLWFTFHMPPADYGCFSLLASFCSDPPPYDTVIAIYHDPNNPCTCVCPNSGEEFLVEAVDDGCEVSGPANLDHRLYPENNPGYCYTIRIGGANGALGSARVSIACLGEFTSSPAVVWDEMPKSRFLSIRFPQQTCGNLWFPQDQALGVRLKSLHHVSPPYTGGPSVPFTSFESQVRWVGPPVQYAESTSQPDLMYVSTLQCQPYYHQWSTIDILHITGSAIVPSSIYEIQTVGGFGDSWPVTARTSRWADIEFPYNPPDPSGQPDFADVSALVNKFRNASGAPIKARALLVGDLYGNFPAAVLSTDFNFSHIAACVDAFKGKPYPHTIQACP